MRFRPANISLINRRHYLPRLLLILSSKRQMQKLPQRFEDVDRVTPYQVMVALRGSSEQSHSVGLSTTRSGSSTADLGILTTHSAPNKTGNVFITRSRRASSRSIQPA